jgi:hypothetical protein
VQESDWLSSAGPARCGALASRARKAGPARRPSHRAGPPSTLAALSTVQVPTQPSPVRRPSRLPSSPHRRAAASTTATAPRPERRHSMRRTYNFATTGRVRTRPRRPLQWCRSAALVGCLPVAVVGSAWDGGAKPAGVAAQARSTRAGPCGPSLGRAATLRCGLWLPVCRPATLRLVDQSCRDVTSSLQFAHQDSATGWARERNAQLNREGRGDHVTAAPKLAPACCV